jgi:TonB-linked SusC/RagA family outer membrane protein
MKKINENQLFRTFRPGDCMQHKRRKMILSAALSLLLFTGFVLSASAQPAVKYTLSFEKTKVKDVLLQLKAKGGISFVYDEEHLKEAPSVSFRVTDASLEEVLDQCFRGTELTYEINNGTVVIKKKKPENTAPPRQEKKITGHIVDENGDPIPSVTVLVKGTTKGTTTDMEGNYILSDIPEKAVLVFSFIGMQVQEILVENRTVINVTMREDVTLIGEVTVNAGYYTVKEKERTGSISIVSAPEIENQPVSNVLSTLQGRMAGVNIIQGSGVPGGGYTIQIRGTNSLRRAGNYPMYIIDGVPVSSQTPSNSISAGILSLTEIDPLNAINPNDIESIEILKDADATAIYGSRGANGVILVTTKKGKAGKPAFNVNSSYGISRVASKMKMMNTEQYLEMRRQAYANDGITTYPANAYDINGTWDQERYTDWQDELIGGTATNSVVQLSVSGGTGPTNFLISGSHNEQTTVFSKDFRYKTTQLSGNLTHRSSDDKFILNASGQFSDQSNNLIQYDRTDWTLRLSPNAPELYQEDGSLNWENGTFTNPVAADECTYSNKSKTWNINLNMGYELFPSVQIKINGGINNLAFDENTLSPHTRYNPAFGFTSATHSSAQTSETQRFSYLLEPQLNYRHKFKDHQLDVLIGATYEQRQSSMLRVSGYGFESNTLITNLVAAKTIYVVQNEVTEYKYAAVFGRINYQYKNRYIVNLTGRRDGSSRFGTDNHYANFGAIGTAWLFSRENFLKDSKWLSFGKLRASLGLTGSDLIGDYQYLDTYSVSSTPYGGSTGLYPSRLYNPYFSWEKTTKLEVALETGFVNDRIHFTIEWYRNRSGNQLVGIPLSRVTGFSSIQSNLPAIVENKGLDLEINTIPVRTMQFRWNSNFNISFPRNKLVAFPGLEGSTYANTYVVGYPVSIIKVYNYEGIDPETGLYTFTDYNEDGFITSPDDNLVIEEVGVKFFGGWSNQISYKHWEFSFLFQFVNQRQSNYLSLGTGYPGTMNNKPVELLDVWSEDNPNGRYMPYTTGANQQWNELLSRFMSSTAAVSDASFIRLKNIQLSYRLPVNKHLQDIQLFVQGQNLWTFTDYFGLDPEGRINWLPPLKTYSFGVQLNF